MKPTTIATFSVFLATAIALPYGDASIYKKNLASIAATDENRPVALEPEFMTKYTKREIAGIAATNADGPVGPEPKVISDATKRGYPHGYSDSYLMERE